MSSQDLHRQWADLLKGGEPSDQLLEEYGLTKADFLERFETMLSPEDLECVRQLPDNIRLWPSGIGEPEVTPVDSVKLTVTFEYSQSPVDNDKER